MKKIAQIIVIVIVNVIVAVKANAQQYDGMSGLIHIPTAEMDDAGDARIGAHFLNKALVPDQFQCPEVEGDSKTNRKYDTYTYYLSITPFSWVEASYTCVLYKYNQPERHGYTAKDRHFALKFNPLMEGKYYPAIAFGGDDFMDSKLTADNIQGKFANYWISATKHFDVCGNEIAVHLGYRYYLKDWNKKYQGINGAVTFRPAFAPILRAICEYDGCHINLGADALLFRHFFIQASLTDWDSPSAGLCYKINLFYKNKKNKQKQ